MKLCPAYRKCLLCLALSSAIALCQEAKQPTAEHQSAGLYVPKIETLECKSVTNIVLHDAKRDKELPIRVIYPKQAGSYPIIVWSHGMYGSKDGYDPLVKHWASHGYVVIQPTHSDSISLMSPEEKRSTLKNLKLDKVGDWQSRPSDVKFLLDSLDELEKKVPELKDRMNRKVIGMGGHSFGAFTAQLVAGTKTRSIGAKKTYADDRPKAFVVISGNGAGPLFDKDSFAGVKRPTIFISGDNDLGRKGEDAPWRKHAYEGASAGDKFLLWVKDAYHDFGGISGAAQLVRQRLGKRMGDESKHHLEIVQSATMAFWDAYLKSDAKAKEYLNKKEVEKTGIAKLSSK